MQGVKGKGRRETLPVLRTIACSLSKTVRTPNKQGIIVSIATFMIP